MYTVFTSDNAPKRGRLGLVVFVRTLAAARAQADPGDHITRWANSGAPLTTWTVGSQGRLHRRADRYAS